MGSGATCLAQGGSHQISGVAFSSATCFLGASLEPSSRICIFAHKQRFLHESASEKRSRRNSDMVLHEISLRVSVGIFVGSTFARNCRFGVENSRKNKVLRMSYSIVENVSGLKTNVFSLPTAFQVPYNAKIRLLSD